MKNYYCKFLGTGNAIISYRKNGPGFFVNMNGKKLLFDMGYGTIRELIKINESYNTIDAIFLSHWHLDHICDLFPTLFLANIPGYFLEKKLPIFAPKGFQKVFDKLVEIFGNWIKSPLMPLEIIELTPTVEVVYKDIKITSYPVVHTDHSLGYRITDGKKIFSYTGDTEKTEGLLSILKDCDLGITECSFPPNVELKKHMNALDILEITGRVNVKKLALVHIYPIAESENIEKFFQNYKNIIIPKDGDTIYF